MEGKLAEYSRALDELGLTGLLKAEKAGEGERLSAITDTIFKSVFYSGPNAHGHDARSLISNGHIDDKDSTLQDYIQLLNMDRVSSFMSRFFESEITPESLLAIRRQGLEGAIGTYTHDGFRSWRVKVGREGTFITAPSAEVRERLEPIVKILDRPVSSESEAIVNISDFFLRYITLHPFDEGNGRSGRIITNIYLLNHGLRPMMATNDRDNKESVLRSTDLSSYSHFEGAYIANTVIGMLGLAELRDRALAGLKAAKTDNPYAIMIKDTLLLALGELSREDLDRDIARLGKAGAQDKEHTHAALWLSQVGKADNPILREAIHSGDDRLMAGAVHAMEVVNFRKYAGDIKETALGGGYYSRMAAIGAMGKRGVFDTDVMHMVDGYHGDIGLNCAVGVYLRNIDSSSAIDTLKSLLNHSSRNLRVRGYHATVAYGSEEDVVDIIENRLRREPREIIKATIEEISRTGKINSSDRIAESLTSWASDDAHVRMIVLGELSGKERVNAAYMPLLDKIARDKRHTETDRIFSLYLIGRERGFGYLQERYGVGIGESNSTLMNTTLALVISQDLKKGDFSHIGEFRPLQDERYNFALALMTSKSGLPEQLTVAKLAEIQAVQDQISQVKLYNIAPSLLDAISNGNGKEKHEDRDLQTLKRDTQSRPRRLTT